MRSLSSVAAVALSILVSTSVMSGQQNPNLSITNYNFVSQQPVTATQWLVTYKADVVNTGGALSSVTATLSSLNPFSFRTVPNKNTLNFAPVPASSQVTSLGTFTILVDRTVAFTFTNLSWTFTTDSVTPVANA